MTTTQTVVPNIDPSGRGEPCGELEQEEPAVTEMNETTEDGGSSEKDNHNQNSCGGLLQTGMASQTTTKPMSPRLESDNSRGVDSNHQDATAAQHKHVDLRHNQDETNEVVEQGIFHLSSSTLERAPKSPGTDIEFTPLSPLFINNTMKENEKDNNNDLGEMQLASPVSCRSSDKENKVVATGQQGNERRSFFSFRKKCANVSMEEDKTTQKSDRKVSTPLSGRNCNDQGQNDQESGHGSNHSRSGSHHRFFPFQKPKTSQHVQHSLLFQTPPFERAQLQPPKQEKRIHESQVKEESEKELYPNQFNFTTYSSSSASTVASRLLGAVTRGTEVNRVVSLSVTTPQVQGVIEKHKTSAAVKKSLRQDEERPFPPIPDLETSEKLNPNSVCISGNAYDVPAFPDDSIQLSSPSTQLQNPDCAEANINEIEMMSIHSSDPPGLLPTPTNDTKEEAMDHAQKAEQMRQELDALLDDIQATADELKHTNPWVVASSTPQTKRQKPDATGTISQSASPAGSDFQNMVSSATLAPTPMLEMESDISMKFASSETHLSFQDDDFSRCQSVDVSYADSHKETPVRSNLTYVQLDAQGSAQYVRDNPVQAPHTMMHSKNALSVTSSEDSEPIHAAVVIQSNTPRTRKILQWLDPNSRKKQDVSDTWPMPSMSTNVRSTNTPERQLAFRKTVCTENGKPHGKQMSDWWAPTGGSIQSSSNRSSSVSSLPSMLGTSSLNEVSDLESPRLNYEVLNYNFSHEESDIHSQSVQDQASEIYSNEMVSPSTSLRSMLNNTYNIFGGVSSKKSQVQSSVDSVVSQLPAEEDSQVSREIMVNVDLEGNVQIHPFLTLETVPSLTDDSSSKNMIGVPRVSWWLRRCAILMLLVAVAAAVAVPLRLKYSPRDQPNPQSSLDFDSLSVITESPTSLSASVSAIKTRAPFPSPTMTPNKRPSSTPPEETDVFGPTEEPSFSTDYLTLGAVAEPWVHFQWNRIEMGENIWRTDREGGTPIWYFGSSGVGYASGISLAIVNAAETDYNTYIRLAVSDYQASMAVGSLVTSVQPYQSICEPEPGKIKVCSGRFGHTDWHGQTILFLKDNLVLSAAIQINSSKKTSPEVLQYTICHQLGHALGLQHREERSCMQDIVGAAIDETAISNQLQHPSQEDLDKLVTLYGPSNFTRLL